MGIKIYNEHCFELITTVNDNFDNNMYGKYFDNTCEYF